MASVVSFLVRSRLASFASLAAVVGAWMMPERGLGLPLCQFKLLTHLPCFTCGMTRSLSGMAHLHVAQAALYHPLGLVFFPGLFLLGALLPARIHVRERLAAAAETKPRLWNYLAAGLLAVLVTYGAGRIWWLLASGRPSPW